MPLLLAALLISVASPAPPSGDKAEAQAKARLIQSITESMNALEYEEARETCLIALDRDDLSDEERVAVHMQAGVAQRVLDRSMESRMHFVQALKIDPDATLPNETSPKIRTFFRLIKGEVLDDTRASAPPASAPVVPTPQTDAPQPADATPWASYSLMGSGAVAIGVIVPLLLTPAAGIYFAVLPQPIDPQTKTLLRYGFFGAVAGSVVVIIVGAAAAAIGGTLLWLE